MSTPAAAPGDSPDLYEALGRTIRVLRTEQGLSRSDLAKRAGVSYSYLSAIENGTKPPSTKIQMLVARALGVHTHELLAAAEARIRGTTREPDDVDEIDQILEQQAERRLHREQARLTPVRRPIPRSDLGVLTELRQLVAQLPDDDLELVMALVRRLAWRN